MYFKVSYKGNEELNGKIFDRFVDAVRAVLRAFAKQLREEGRAALPLLDRGVWIELEDSDRQIRHIANLNWIRNIAYIIGLLKEPKEGNYGFVFAPEGGVTEPPEDFLLKAFTLLGGVVSRPWGDGRWKELEEDWRNLQSQS